MKILSLRSKTKKEIRGLKKKSYKEYDKNGKLKTNHYVEFEVIGRNRQWVDFMPLADFKRLNPKIKI